MRIACGGDQHLTTRKPKNRIDKYSDTIIYKFRQELAIADEENCSVLVLPGDVFDSFKENHLIAQQVIYTIRRHKVKVLAVAGQHDQHFHNEDLSGTALETVLASGAITLLTDNPLIINNEVAFYGASWKKGIPEIATLSYTNILAIHQMIIDEKLWAEQEGHTWANHILLKNKFDLIVSGDNHQQFTVSKHQKHLVNMGSLGRSTIAQINHHPAICIYDTENKGLEIVDIDCKPFEEVMQIKKAEKEKEKNEQMKAFAKSLGKDTLDGRSEILKLNFTDALEEYVEKNEIPKEISEILFDCLT